MKNSSNDRKRRTKGRGKKLLLIILGLVFLVILFRILIQKVKNAGNIEPSGFYSITADSVEKQMVLSSDSTALKVGEDKTLQLTLYVPEEIAITDETDINVYDEEGTLYGTMYPSESVTKDGYQEYISSVDIKSPEEGAVLLHAEAAGKESQDLTLYCTPEITEEMILKCCELGADLQEYIDENKIEEKMEAGEWGYSKKKVLKRVKKWLEKDERCLHAEINGPNVLYLTQDSILGAYTLPAEEGYLGSSVETDNNIQRVSEASNQQEIVENELEEEQIDDHNTSSMTKKHIYAIPFSTDEEGMFSSFCKNGNLDSIKANYSNDWIYIDGLNSITNKNFLIWSGNNLKYENPNAMTKRDPVYIQYQKVKKTAEEYRAKMNYSVNEVFNADILEQLISLKLQKNGIVSFTTHGGYLEYTSDSKSKKNSYLSVYFIMPELPDEEKETMISRSDQLNNGWFNYLRNTMPADQYQDMFSLFYTNQISDKKAIDNKMVRLFISCNGQIAFTSNIIKDYCQKDFYDNTVIIINNCYGILDESLAPYLLNHGAKVVTGYNISINQLLSDGYVKRLLGEFLIIDKKGNRKRIDEVDLDTVISNVTEQTFYESDWIIDKFYDAYKDKISWVQNILEPIHPKANTRDKMIKCYNRPAFTLESFGDLSGKILKKSTAYYYDKNSTLKEEKEIMSPAKGINVSSYRFLNQTYEDCSTEATTGDDGIFTLAHQIWGVLGLKISGESIKTMYADTTFTGNKYDGGEIVADAKDSEYDGYVAYMDADRNIAVPAPDAGMTFKLISAASEKDSKKVGTEVKIIADKDGHFNTGSLVAGKYEVIGAFNRADIQYKGTFELELKGGCSYFHEDPLILEGKLLVTGNVLDAESGVPISGITVALTLNGQTYYSITDGNGNFIFKQLDSGYAEIVIDTDGYERYSNSFYLDRSERLSNIQLEKLANYEIDDFFGYYLDGFAGMGLYKKPSTPSGVGYITFLVDKDDPEPLDTMHTINILRTVTGYDINKNVLTLYTDMYTLVCVLNADKTDLEVTVENNTIHYTRVE